jgi:hypothetical protein
MLPLQSLINELETKIEHSEKLNISISKAPVGWHVQHSLIVLLQIINAMEKSDPAEYRYKFSMMKFIVYTLNKIPRGKAKAPEVALPKEKMNMDEMKQNIEQLKTRLAVLDTLQPDNYFRHPYFGNLNLKAAIKMLKLHTKHHLHIINDIIRGC